MEYHIFDIPYLLFQYIFFDVQLITTRGYKRPRWIAQQKREGSITRDQDGIRMKNCNRRRRVARDEEEP